ncbi:transposase [Mesorhizobium sp. M0843]|uniref:transposase n=1 Tax=Mesorhizobium sp. M0843 TaxID=2957010 RepID=UPI00333DF7E9
MAIEKEVLDRLLAGRDLQELFAKDGLLDDLNNALSERRPNAGLDDHLDEERATRLGTGATDIRRRRFCRAHRSSYFRSRVTVRLLRPDLIAKYQRRFPDFRRQDRIHAYARHELREIRGHPEELYGIEVSPDLISAVTHAVLEEVAEWQNSPLDACFPLVVFDAIRVKIRDEGFVCNKAIYVALVILPNGGKEILGIWIEQTEGARASAVLSTLQTPSRR